MERERGSDGGKEERLVNVREPHHMRFMNFPVFLALTERKTEDELWRERWTDISKARERES